MAGDPNVIAKMDLPPIREMGDDMVVPELKVVGMGDNDNGESNSAESGEQAEDDTSGAGNEDTSGNADTTVADGSAPDTQSGEPASEAAAEDSGQGDGEDLALLKAQAEQWAQLEHAFKTDPTALITNLTKSLPADQAQAIVAALSNNTVTATPEAFREDDELTPEERFVKKNATAITDVPRLRKEATEAFQQVNAVQHTHAYELAQVKAELAALREVIGLDIPKADLAKVRAQVARGTSYEDAIKSLIAPQIKLAVEKAKATPPTTPKNSGTTKPKPLPKDASFTDIFMSVKRELAQRG